MRFRKHLIASLVVAVGLAIVAAIALTRAPVGMQLPVHWNAAGEGDRFLDAGTALFMPVALTVLVTLVMAAVPRIEPLQRDMEGSAALLGATWSGLLLFTAALEWVVAAPVFGIAVPPAAMLVIVGLLLAMIGNALPKSRPGFFVGIRTPWALIDTDNWIATHRLGGRTMLAGGVAIAGFGLLPLSAQVRAPLVMAALAVVIVVPVGYSYLLWYRRPRAG